MLDFIVPVSGRTNGCPRKPGAAHEATLHTWRRDARSKGRLLPDAEAGPESNGVCEAFVKTLKRDYVRVNPCPDALSVLRQLPEWFDDYNAVHPHSGLRMRSPREFIASQPSTPAACPV
jgi:transposase InsO family protein